MEKIMFINAKKKHEIAFVGGMERAAVLGREPGAGQSPMNFCLVFPKRLFLGGGDPMGTRHPHGLLSHLGNHVRHVSKALPTLQGQKLSAHPGVQVDRLRWLIGQLLYGFKMDSV
jgi:hypothetical protein